MSDDNPQQAPLPKPPADGAKRRCLTILLTLVVFASGLAIGSGLSFMYMDHLREHYRNHPEEAPYRFAERLRKELGLNDAQAKQVQDIIVDRWPKYMRTRREVYSAFEVHLGALDKDIAAVLREDQRQRWDEYMNRLRRNMNPPEPATAPAGDAPAAETG